MKGNTFLLNEEGLKQIEDYPLPKRVLGWFTPPGFLYGLTIRVDNRIRFNRLAPDKKHGGLKCNQEMYDRIKNHPGMKDYEFK